MLLGGLGLWCGGRLLLGFGVGFGCFLGFVSLLLLVVVVVVMCGDDGVLPGRWSMVSLLFMIEIP